MDIQKEKTLFFAFLESEFPLTVADLKSQGVDPLDHFNTEWDTWQAAKAQAVPEGFVLVLKNASREMIKQGYEAHDGFFTLGSVRNVWDAMIEAQERSHD